MMHCTAQCSLLTDVLSALDLASQVNFAQYCERLGREIQLLMLPMCQAAPIFFECRSLIALPKKEWQSFRALLPKNICQYFS